MALDEMMGYNFQPGQDNTMRRTMNQGATDAGGNMANQALRVLSLRLPNVLGGRPLSTGRLMTPPMGGTGPTGNGPSLATVGANGPGANVTGGVGPGGGQAPSFTPGLTNPNNPPPISGVENGGGNYSYFPTPGSPSNWTPSGPLTGGITGGGNYGMGGGTETQMPTMDLNVIQGLMRLFGRG